MSAMENVISQEVGDKKIIVDLLLDYWGRIMDLVDGNIDESSFENPETITYDRIIAGEGDLLRDTIKTRINAAARQILDNLESGLANDHELFKILRPKVLRACNDAFRNISDDIGDFNVLKVKERQTKTVFRRED